MIRLENVSKQYRVHSGDRTVLKDVNFSIARGERWGILGRNGAGKSTLIRLISGAERPSGGKIVRDMSVSWPLAFGGAFQGSLTGRDNVRFICRVYGVDFERAIDFVNSFSELGMYLREPVKKYSSGMRQRLAFAISMAVEFDCFLIDEVVSVGDSRFHEKCHSELFDKRGDRAMIIVSHVVDYVRERCDRAALLIDGDLKVFDDVEEAISAYHAL
ncbi:MULTISPECIES: ABC transporter ATP-binding protein [Burkholderia cepacia complex]|uniref:ABC transporter ATP-binding protein n=2 Tax=Burkholderia cepacia complex TaxID=87882 RepID=A0A3N8Q7X2_9BURK|nr:MULTISPECIES: ATP-binding cassette domain-containing protein [Burkholderia cepacia complex]MBA9895725.1 ABC transporter ATP-binding protein [Burkholderia cepacia]MBA9942866.1 ABC transporter ATP-binding protein [Burkholderia cepacia]MBA9979542.1 ABC transporter ATP-binding protein [Burkholderia cepacia]MBA9998436.1 ABC transporter ATP-binding protein [Burkholderia cepacia]MBB0005934.1 ABC transporter ATP-binding protein [Burkholderia cepacia]